MPDPSRRPPSAVPISALSTVLLGIALTVAARTFDGFAQGLFQGAGVATILIGVVVLSAHARQRGSDRSERDLWLPSRDEDRE